MGVGCERLCSLLVLLPGARAYIINDRSHDPPPHVFRILHMDEPSQQWRPEEPWPWKDGSLGVSVTRYPEEDILLGQLGLELKGSDCFRV